MLILNWKGEMAGRDSHQLNSSIFSACSEQCVSLILGCSQERRSLNQEFSNQATRAVLFQQKKTTTGTWNRIHLENVQYQTKVSCREGTIMVRLFSTQWSQIHFASVTLFPMRTAWLVNPMKQRSPGLPNNSVWSPLALLTLTNF